MVPVSTPVRLSTATTRDDHEREQARSRLMLKQDQSVNEINQIKSRLAERVKEHTGQNVFLCYQCVKCTSGCPLGEYLDWQPNQIMRALQLGQDELALKAQTPWLCACCQTCSTRCPQGLDVTMIMEFITREAIREGIQSAVPAVKTFNEAFMREIHLWGRAYEVGVMAEMKLRTRDLKSDLDLGVKLIAKNKLPFLPEMTRSPQKVKAAVNKSGSVAYYPGCSLHSTAQEYNISAQSVCSELGLTLIEPKGWVCCGSTAAHRSAPEDALRLPMQNLRLIEQSGFDEVVMPCAACFSRHKFALHTIRHDKEKKARMDETLGYVYQGNVIVSSLAEALFRRIGPKDLAEKVARPLTGLKVVCYYGCLLSRPPEVTDASHPENPMELDNLISALGANVLDWSYKTSCCGASHSVTRPDIVHGLSSKLIDHARQTGADAIAVACPLCHMNLDARQFQMKLETPMPVLFFTQLIALALGLPDKAMAFNKNLVDPRPLLRQKGLYEG